MAKKDREYCDPIPKRVINNSFKFVQGTVLRMPNGEWTPTCTSYCPDE